MFGQANASSCLIKNQLKEITTYDGRQYDLDDRDTCNYVLVRDCRTKLFSIHLVKKYRNVGKDLANNDDDDDNNNNNNNSPSNHIKFDGASLWIKIDNVKVYLTHFDRVRVNGSLVSMPFIRINSFSIFRFNNQIKLRSSIGEANQNC